MAEYGKRCFQPPLLRLCERSEAYILARSANTGTKLLDFRPIAAFHARASRGGAASPNRPSAALCSMVEHIKDRGTGRSCRFLMYDHCPQTALFA